MTLRELMEQHPEMADLPIVVYSSDGSYHYIGGSGMFYKHEDRTEEQAEGEGTPVLVMAPN